MKKEMSDEELISYLEGAPNAAMEEAIASDASLKARVAELRVVLGAIEQSHEAEVPTHIGVNLQMAIAEEMSKSTRPQGFSWMQIAAAVTILIVGFALGQWSGDTGSGAELAQLRDEIQSLREVTLTSTLQKHSASERIMAVSRIEERGMVNEELLTTLISTLNSDESPSVRYAALQALQKFIGTESVRAELVKSLETQTDPLIQISLITILVEAEERSAIAPLKEIMNKEELTPEVRQQAEVALKVLT